METGSPLRFALLRHERTQDTHWDLLLEVPGQEALWTWQIHTPPERWNDGPVAALRLPDHRRIYLDYEGEISGGRGRVMRVDGGFLRWDERGEKRLAAVLQGATVRRVLLVDEDGWVLRTA